MKTAARETQTAHEGVRKRPRSRKKDILAALIIILLLAFVISGTKIQSVDEYYLTHIDDITPQSATVTLSIECKTVLENLSVLDPALKAGDFVPEDGVILPCTRYVLRPGDTVYDILSRAVRYNKIQMEYQGADKNSFSGVYIKGINYLYEFSCGPLSGWMYTVNGIFPQYGCSKYELEDGDVIEWVYTCDLGRDVGDDYYEKIKNQKNKKNFRRSIFFLLLPEVLFSSYLLIFISYLQTAPQPS